MRTIKLILVVVCAVMLLQSCEKEGKMRVQNNISKVRITDVKWGGEYVASELLPGETSSERVFDSSSIPGRHSISFKMTANNQTVYLQTEEVFLLDDDDDLLIVLDNNTKVGHSTR